MSNSIARTLLAKLLGCTAALFAVAPLDAATCSVTAAVLSFGQYNGLASAPNLSPGVVRVSCTKDPAAVTETVTLTLQLLPSPPGTAGSRKLDLGGSSLSFDMFVDVLRTRPWGDGSAGTSTISGVLVLTAVNTAAVIEFPVYGRIPTGLPSPVGSYSGQFAILLIY